MRLLFSEKKSAFVQAERLCIGCVIQGEKKESDISARIISFRMILFSMGNVTRMSKRVCHIIGQFLSEPLNGKANRSEAATTDVSRNNHLLALSQGQAVRHLQCGIIVIHSK